MPIFHILLTLLVIAVWGFNFVVVKVGLQDMPPLLLCALRFLIACVPTIFFIKPPAVPFKLVLAYGLTIFVLQFSFLFVGLYLGMPAGLASLLLQTHVFFTILLAILFLGEIPNRWQVAGGLVAFAGIGIVVMNLNAEVTLSGFVLVIAAAIAWGVGNLISKKMGKVNIIALITWGSFVALPPFCLLSLTMEGTAAIASSFHHISWLSIACLIYIVYASTWFGYGIWNYLLSQYTVATVAPFTLLVPVVAMLGSSLVLGEELQSWKIAAGLFVILGIAINLAGTWVITNNKRMPSLSDEVIETAD